MKAEHLIEQIKHNCNISDAGSWGYYSICSLLMRLRGLYRSEHSLKPWQSLPEKAVMKWIAAREALWQELDGAELVDIEISGDRFSPFDAPGINRKLNPEGYLYGGGYGLFGKPTFFLARLREQRESDGYTISVAGQELCRDLAASAAMQLGTDIFVRLEALGLILWDRYQEFRGRKFGGALGEAFSSAGIDRGEDGPEEVYEKIRTLSLKVAQILSLHELGEAVEGGDPERWLRIIGDNRDKWLELYLRGIKDMLADCSEKGPLKMIIDGSDRVLLGFYIVLLDGIRKELFPEITGAFQECVQDGNWAAVEGARVTGYERARSLMGEIVSRGEEDTSAIKPFLKEYLSRGGSGKGPDPA